MSRDFTFLLLTFESFLMSGSLTNTSPNNTQLNQFAAHDGCFSKAVQEYKQFSELARSALDLWHNF